MARLTKPMVRALLLARLGYLVPYRRWWYARRYPARVYEIQDADVLYEIQDANVPVALVAAATVRALERRGLLARATGWPNSWSSPRELTASGWATVWSYFEVPQ